MTDCIGKKRLKKKEMKKMERGVLGGGKGCLRGGKRESVGEGVEEEKSRSIRQ
jgi:hypothetical protein